MDGEHVSCRRVLFVVGYSRVVGTTTSSRRHQATYRRSMGWSMEPSPRGFLMKPATVSAIEVQTEPWESILFSICRSDVETGG